jgi:hypothetical protein
LKAYSDQPKIKMPRSVIFLLAALVSSSSASLLRGLGQRSEILREVKPDSFDCSPYELDGLGEIGVKISPKWICKLESAEAEANQSFTFQGDIKSIMKNNFNADITIPGATKMTIPWDAINNSDSTIMSNHAGITISQDHGHRERHLASTQTSHRVLIVRVVTNGSTIASADKLKNDFYQDENNLVRDHLSDEKNTTEYDEGDSNITNSLLCIFLYDFRKRD